MQELEPPVVVAEAVLSPRRIPSLFGQRLPQVLSLLGVFGISVTLLTLRDRLDGFAALGYIGIFLLSLIGSGSIVLPLPTWIVVLTLGATPGFSPILIGACAGLGSAIGEFSGYLAGYGGQSLLENRPIYERMRDWMSRHGSLALFLLSAIPNVVIKVGGAAAGASNFSPWKFFLVVLVGKCIKDTTIALAGFWGVSSLLH